MYTLFQERHRRVTDTVGMKSLVLKKTDTRINTVLVQQTHFHLHLLFNNLLYIQEYIGKYPSITSFDLRKIALDLVNI